MDTFNGTYSLFRISYKYWIGVFLFFYFNTIAGLVFGQDLLSGGAYRTATYMDGIGDWNDPSIWEVWDGTLWAPAPAPPDRNHDVFIEKDKEVRLTQNQEVRNLYLYGRDSTESPPGRKLNLQVFNLDVYGSLLCIKGVDGNYSIQNLTSGITDWIYPETGNIVFKGGTKTIVDRASWSASNGRSRYGVIFNPDPEDTLYVNAAFKASRFVVKSGTVVQKVNYDGAPATSTFSFNTMSEFGDDAYGEFIIEPGATLISEGTKEFSQILRRSEGKPASRFELMEGANLILLGEEPIIEAENILLGGNVYYGATTGNQQFISGSMDGVTAPTAYNHLFFEGNAAKDLPDNLELKGDFTFIAGGAIEGTNTSLRFTGGGNQTVRNTILELGSAEVNKAFGTLFLEDDLIVRDQLAMTAGEVDFNNSRLDIGGGYQYVSGSWSNLFELLYQNVPPTLTETNSSFPFADAYLGGVRKLVLSGTLSTPATGLSIIYHQLPGVNWDPAFNDLDNASILYKLNSYFTFALENASVDPLEIRIAADNLVVVDDEHLRIVGNDAAAPGTHLLGMGRMARREVNLNDLNGQSITLGTTGVASILPVTWLSYQAEELSSGNLISWSTAKEEANQEFIVLKSFDAKDFVEIGHVPGKGHSNEVQHYQFLDKGINSPPKVYYQIKQVDVNGSHDFSPLFKLALKSAEEKTLIFPNPYRNQADRLTLKIPPKKAGAPANIVVKNLSGKSLIQEAGPLDQASQKTATKLQALGRGAYLIIIEVNQEREVIKWLNGY